MLMLISWTWGCTTFHNFISMFKKKIKSWQVCDWLAKWLIMSGYMDLRRPRVYRRSNVGLVQLVLPKDPVFQNIHFGTVCILRGWYSEFGPAWLHEWLALDLEDTEPRLSTPSQYTQRNYIRGARSNDFLRHLPGPRDLVGRGYLTVPSCNSGVRVVGWVRVACS